MFIQALNYHCILENSKPDIRSLSKEQLSVAFKNMGEQPFRAKQVYEWLWKKSATSFNEMTNLSKSLREKLTNNYVINAVKVDSLQKSNDKTIKYGFRLHDNYLVEGVLIPTPKRVTACISSQVGCTLTCKFCATGRLKRERNLTADEIYDQVAVLKTQAEKEYGNTLSNIVYMGMGEPLLNYRNVLESIEKITSPEGLGISPKRITVSTAGIAKLINKLGDDNVKFNLALSLHAANDSKRSEIMPINDQNSLKVLSDSLQYFYSKTGTRVTFEYIIFKDFNDTLDDARELANFCKNIPCKVNIIEYNPIEDGEFQQADKKDVDNFAGLLESRNIVVNIRRSRGKDIDAACGQLANKSKNKSNFHTNQ